MKMDRTAGDRTAGEKIAYTSSFNFRDHLRYGYNKSTCMYRCVVLLLRPF